MNNPTLQEAIMAAVKSTISGIHTAIPGIIESYDYTTCKAEVKPSIKRQYVDGSVLSMPIIVNVPVIWPRTKNGSITFPLERGDSILIIFSERSLENWLSKGHDVTPGDRRKFDISDAIAIPGLFSFDEPVKTTSNDKFEIHYNDSSITINSSGQVNINNGNLTIDL